MKEVQLEILDQVNCRFVGLDPGVKRKLRQKFRHFLNYARHMPAYKSGYWDGYAYLIDQGGRTFIGCLDEMIPMLVDEGWNIDLDDKRQAYTFEFPKITDDIFSHKVWPKNHKHEGEPIVLKDHQVEALQSFVENPKCIQELPTSSGKTLITAAMSYFTEKYGKSIVIVPNKSLILQTEEDFKNLGLDVGVYYGDRKELDRTHTICTWQILDVLSKKSKRNKATPLELKAIEQLFNEIVTVIVDEVHQASSDSIKKLLAGPLAHCPIRWGLTGTIPKDPHDREIIKCVLGEIVNIVTPKELQDAGVIANCQISILQIKDQVEFPDYHTEHEYLVQDSKRLEWLAEFITKTAATGNTLCLVSRIPTGQKLASLVPGSIFISGGMKADERKEHYNDVHDSQFMPLIATYGVAAVGINIPRLFNLILFEPGKSFVRVIQSVGRSLRLAKDKDYSMIFDITSTCRFSKRHLTERKKYYKEKEYPFTITKVDF